MISCLSVSKKEKNIEFLMLSLVHFIHGVSLGAWYPDLDEFIFSFAPLILVSVTPTSLFRFMLKNMQSFWTLLPTPDTWDINTMYPKCFLNPVHSPQPLLDFAIISSSLNNFIDLLTCGSHSSFPSKTNSSRFCRG